MDDNGYRHRVKQAIFEHAYGRVKMTEAKYRQLGYELTTTIGRQQEFGTRLHERIEQAARELPKFEITPEFVEAAGLISQPGRLITEPKLGHVPQNYMEQAQVYTYGLRTAGLISPGTCGQDVERLRDADREADRYERGMGY